MTEPEKITAVPRSLPSGPFYWALLNAGQTAGSKLPRMLQRCVTVPPGLLPELAEQIPMSVEDVHAVCVPSSDGRLIACAVPKAELQSLDASTPRFSPASIPSELGSLASGASLNLLVGPFEPLARRRSRTRRHLTAMTAVGLLAMLLALGLSRRASHAESVSQEASVTSNSILRQGLTTPPDARSLSAELERLRRIAAFDPSIRRSPDAAAALASVLGIWPASVPTNPQSISIGPDGVSIALLVPGDPSAFLSAFKSPPGWTMDEPRLTSIDSQTRLTLRLSPMKSARGVH